MTKYISKINRKGTLLTIKDSEARNSLQTKSNINHNHDSSYSALGHTHDDRYYTESEVDTKLNGKANTSHTHDDRYYQKSQVYQKSETYTKKETEGYVQSKFGLKYDAENRAVIVPVASVATYQKSKRMIDFTGIAY